MRRSGRGRLLMCFWMIEHLEAIRAAILFFGLIAGGIGLYLARWRCLTADRNLLRERCQMGLELLSLNPQRYTARVAGASILSEILNSNSIEYDSSILRAFEAFLFSPPGFGMKLGNHNKGETDYESREKFLIVNALRRYARKQDAQSMLPLPPGLVFTITGNTVEPNQDHEHYKRWVEARGGPPKYSDQRLV